MKKIKVILTAAPTVLAAIFFSFGVSGALAQNATCNVAASYCNNNPGIYCTQDSDCTTTTGGATCNQDTNFCNNNPSKACTTDADCAATSSSGCKTDADCQSGQKCDTTKNACYTPTTAGCKSDADCQNGQKCNTSNGTCYTPSSPTPTSNTNIDCGPNFTLDKTTGICMPSNTSNPGSIAASSSITELLATIIKWLLTLAGAVAVALVVVGGFWYITSAGNEEQAEKGKNTLVNAIIGLIIVVLAYALVTIIVNTLSKGP